MNTYIPADSEPLANSTAPTNGTIITLANAAMDINDLVGTDTDGGYVLSTSDNYNTKSDATLHSDEIDLDGTNSVFVTAGLIPTAGGSAGAAFLPRIRK